ncbi:unannotated protein [freshwater metagenome]|uniref:Unannotated protein n=1 Tax=freshwater metagenome TaxID=449393 RepID=A0A6J7HXX3_9ZZZZ|nr:hypothetical protein [Actinomycetota bacterium]
MKSVTSRRITIISFCTVLAIFSSSGFAWAAGISSQSDLQAISIDGDYVLTSTINLDNTFVPISEFKGTINGAGYSIIMTASLSKPIFILLTDAKIEDLSLNAKINSGDILIGALAGTSTNSQISDINLTGTISGGNKTGGLIGSVDATSSISNITVSNLTLEGGTQGTGAISATNAGQISNVTVSQDVTIHGSSNTGGIAGINSGTITNATFDGNVKGYEILGGIAGQNSGSIIDATYGANADIVNDGVNFTYRYIGGITGKNSGTISGADINGDVMGLEKIGGVAGENEATGVITNSVMNGKVFGDPLSPLHESYLYLGNEMGGIVGLNEGKVRNSTVNTTAQIEGTASVGGVVGKNQSAGEIRNSTVKATILAIYNAGGIAGVNDVLSLIHTSSVNAVINASFPVGGIAGTNAGNIYNSRSSSNINGDGYVGGIAGLNSGTIVNAVVSERSRINGNGATGGAVGVNTGTVFKVLINGEVSAFRLAAGVVGINSGTVYLSNFSGKLDGEITQNNSENIDGGTTNQVTSKILDLMSDAKVETILISEEATIQVAEDIIQSLIDFGITTSLPEDSNVYQIALDSNDFAKTQFKSGSSIQMKIQGTPEQTQSLWMISSLGKIFKFGDITFDVNGSAVLPVLNLTKEDNLQFVWGSEISPIYNSDNEIESLSVGSSTGILNIEVKD